MPQKMNNRIEIPRNLDNEDVLLQQCCTGANQTDVLLLEEQQQDMEYHDPCCRMRKDSFAAICFPFLLDDDDGDGHNHEMDSEGGDSFLLPSTGTTTPANDTSCPRTSKSIISHNYDSLASKKKKDNSTRTLNQKDHHCKFPSYIPSYKKSKLLSNSWAIDGSFEPSQEEQSTTSQATDTMMMKLLLQDTTTTAFNVHGNHDYSHHDSCPRGYYSSSSSLNLLNENKNAGMSDFFTIMKGSMTPSGRNGSSSHNSYSSHKRYPNASPVPSLASSEYSVSSPCSFLEDDPIMNTPRNLSRGSPVMFMNGTPALLQDDVSFATCMGPTGDDNVSPSNIKDNTCTPSYYKSTPQSSRSATSHAYYFTPVVQTPLSHGHENSNSFREEFYETYSSPPAPRQKHEGFPQCMEVSSNRECEIASRSIVGKNAVVSNPSSLSCSSSYLSTAIRGCEASKNMTNVIVSNQSPVSHRVKTSNEQTVQVSPSSLSPLPQNLKGDPLRQAKVKTELCLFFSRGKPCPFGAKCNYAHGEDELKYTRLVEMDRAGLVADIKSYRAYPCFSWVSTGACPFGLRCSNIHDPRTAGIQPSWLPHCDIPVSNLSTESVVDKSHYRNMTLLGQKNPIVQNLLWNERPSLKKKNGDEASHDVSNKDDTEWRDTYSLVCNLANLNPNKTPKMNIVAKTKISELQRLCIAADMNYGSDQCTDFVYKPKHLVYNELCMVLRTKYYCLLNPQDISGTFNIKDCPPIHRFVKEISKEEYDIAKKWYNEDAAYKSDQVIVVQELAFGCVGEQTSRVSLWYDLPEVTELSPQEVKRLKRNKQRSKGPNSEGPHNVTCYPGYERTCSSMWSERSCSARIRTATSFDSHPHKPFFRVEPVTKCSEAVELVRKVLYHRISVLIQREYRAYSANESVVKEIIISQDAKLEKMFQNIKKDVQMWQWPVSKGREIITEETKVPKTLTEYNPSSPSQVTPIWEGFLSLLKLQGNDSAASSCEPSDTALPIFQKLAKSEKVNHSKALPHITSQSKNRTENDFMESFFCDWNQISAHYVDGNNTPPISANA